MKQIKFEPTFYWLDALSKKLDTDKRGMFFRISVSDKNSSVFDAIRSSSYLDKRIISKDNRMFEIISNNNIDDDMCKIEELNEF